MAKTREAEIVVEENIVDVNEGLFQEFKDGSEAYKKASCGPELVKRKLKGSKVSKVRA